MDRLDLRTRQKRRKGIKKINNMLTELEEENQKLKQEVKELRRRSLQNKIQLLQNQITQLEASVTQNQQALNIANELLSDGVEVDTRDYSEAIATSNRLINSCQTKITNLENQLNQL